MSRTKRKDRYIEANKTAFNSDKPWKDTADKKKSYKPNKKFKKAQDKGKKARLKQELKKDDPDNTPAPKDPKEHMWNWN